MEIFIIILICLGFIFSLYLFYDLEKQINKKILHESKLRADGLRQLQSSISDLRSSLVKYKVEIDQVQDHFSRIRDSQLILNEAIKNPKKIQVRILDNSSLRKRVKK